MDVEKLSKFVKLPTFDGDEEKFQLWLVRFEAYSTCCGFRAAPPPSISTPSTFPADKSPSSDLCCDQTKETSDENLLAPVRQNLFAPGSQSAATSNASTGSTHNAAAAAGVAALGGEFEKLFSAVQQTQRSIFTSQQKPVEDVIAPEIQKILDKEKTRVEGATNEMRSVNTNSKYMSIIRFYNNNIVKT